MPSSNPVTVDSVTRNDRMVELARAQHPRILATYGGEYSDPKLERMVAKVVGSLTVAAGNPDQTYQITILNSPNVNAFALPGGFLYVTRGLLALANDSAELAAVIAHEMGNAGYDPFSAARFLQSMASYADFRSVSGATDASLDFLASHPNAPQRIELAQRHARQFGAPGVGTRDRDSFLEGVDGMLFGDTPEEGYVRGRAFLHPTLGVTFTVPEGFVIDNSASAVTAAGPGDVAIRFDGVALDRGITLENYLRSGWVAGLDPASVRATSINGQDAAVALAGADGWQFHIAVIRAGGQVYRLLTAAPAKDNTLQPAAQSVLASFKVLSEAEKRSLKPLRVRVVTVKPGETLGMLAARMKGVGRAFDLFRLLNALPPGGTVSTGDKVKIITDE